ncbi:uncharacterized protein LOC128263173 [Drosophila gunungcola]|uniref:CUB domain-containing protein n=1 Tax=Drosophila gunungcola TaxID=103775 RepID=A0A9Q0BRY7_9MUSC|nr:uncharacterized protein LOC128263173 [Drosophila gunungcola]KAI8042412.1 hypothetical protein M5D96_003725 [Drosophila gunungcola]
MAVDMDREAIKMLSTTNQVDANQSDSNSQFDCQATAILRGGKKKGRFSQKSSARKKKVIAAGCGGHLLPSLAAALCILSIPLGLTPPVSSMSPANETAWPPMRHYDIWDDHPGDLEEESLAEEMDLQEQLDMEMQQQDDVYDGSHNQTNGRQGKVIHLFPVPVDGDCLSNDGRRMGNCLNAYECRQKDGQAKGECAMGFGVCCVFLASCNTTISNNITYIVSPGFPSFMPSNFSGCSLRVKMMSDEISQVRIDFHHFTLGQPNRRTGVCEGDVFSIGGGPGGNFSLCGQNSGQHLYYDVGARASPRQSTLYGSLRPVDAGNGSTSNSTGERFIDISLNLSNRLLPLRLWEMSVVQIPFNQRAPAGCLQYHTGREGIMQTFNFAENGRHLANQNYRICVRQESDMCSIMYQPCDELSFRIGGGGRMATRVGDTGGGGSPTTTNNAAVQSNPAVAQSDVAGATATSASAAMTTAAPTSSTLMQMLANMANSTTTTLMTMMSGNTTSAASAASSPSSSSSTAAMSTTTTSTSPAPLRSSTESSSTSQAPASSPASDDVEGSGGEDGGVGDDDDDGGFLFFRSRPTTEEPGVSRRPRPSGGFDIMGIIRNALDLPLKWRRRQARQFFSTCSDRITMPCIIEDFIGTGLGPLPGCEPVHCGAQFCSSGVWPCRIESTVTPFYIGVRFGNGLGAGKANAEDNVGACLRFSQVQCM